MATIELRQVGKSYGGQVALHPLDLAVADGEFLTLLGPSGCGKTTTLRMIAGFVEPSAGRILIGGEDVTRVSPHRRGIGMVFQDYALFPHMTIADNIGFGLVERGVSKPKVRARVGELLDLIQLPQIAARYPSQISGGQQQRVALARAVAHTPRVLLMDEPLGALDLKMREQMQTELRQVQRKLGITTVYVTHDQTEAMNLSDSIAVMSHGRVVQRGTAEHIYGAPASRFVAGFIGQINFLEGVLRSGDGDWDTIVAAGAQLHAPHTPALAAGAVTLGVRPEHLRIASEGDAPAPGCNVLHGRVVARVFSGNLCHFRVAVADTVWAVETRPGAHDLAEGCVVQLAWQPEHSLALRE